MYGPLKSASLAPFWKRFERYVAASRTKNVTHFDPRLTPRIGLCVSGGPDSMALAYLLSTYVKTLVGVESLDHLYGFIVDHDARPESAEEAQTVRQWLEHMGIQSMITKMDWKEQDPSKLTDFELQARVRRYQQLGSMAKANHVHHLFTGHHQDDQIETVLFRLNRGQSPSFLAVRGMQETSPIPECDHLRGFRNAEPSVPIAELLNESDANSLDRKKAVQDTRERPQGPNFHTGRTFIRGLPHGGVMLHRPLLSFTKSELIATCEANGIEFKVDATNADPTYTRRNAIRVLRTRNLPRALSPVSLLNLVVVAEQKRNSILDRAKEFLRRVSILVFDFRSGTITLRLPHDFASFAEGDPAAAANVVSNLCATVTPYQMAKQQTLAPSHVVQDILRCMQRSTHPNPPKFTLSGVVFEVLPRDSDDSSIWRLSRMPMMDLERQTNTCTFDGEEADQHTSLSGKDKIVPYTRSRWLLWDHRWWIRVSTDRAELLPHLQLRPYTMLDGKALKEVMPKRHFGQLTATLKMCASNKTRYTLPVLTLQDKVIAAPTLHRNIMNMYDYVGGLRRLGLTDKTTTSWEVAYKLLPKHISAWGTTLEDHEVHLNERFIDSRNPAKLVSSNSQKRIAFQRRVRAYSNGD